MLLCSVQMKQMDRIKNAISNDKKQKKMENNWTNITDNSNNGGLIKVLVALGSGGVVTVVASNWNWMLNILSTVFGIK